MRGGEDNEIKRTKSRRKNKKDSKVKKGRVMITAGERDERVEDWSSGPHPPEKGWGRGEREGRARRAQARALARPCACTYATPGGAETRGREGNTSEWDGNGSTCSMVSICKGRCNQRSLKLHNC